MVVSQKVVLHQACVDLIQSKMSRLEQNVLDAQKAASEDTKSSAGDKFETSREMLKQEINKYIQQLSQLSLMLHQLQKLSPEKNKNTVGAGSLVRTNEGTYYFSVGLGKILVEGQNYFALSMASPIARALNGRKAGESVSFMQRQIQILQID